VRIPAHPALDIGTNAVTLSLWVKLTTLPSQLTKSVACIYDDRDRDAYCLYLDRAARELRFKITDTAGFAARPGIPEALLQTGVWHHVAGVYDGAVGRSAGQAMIFLDGRLADLHTGGDGAGGRELTQPVRPGQAAAIGRNGLENNYYFAGDVDEVAVWARPLHPAEIRQVHAAGLNGQPLERSVMTVWITNVYPDPANGNMRLDLRVEHGTLTNQIREPPRRHRHHGPVYRTDQARGRPRPLRPFPRPGQRLFPGSRPRRPHPRRNPALFPRRPPLTRSSREKKRAAAAAFPLSSPL
jgi:hypothetical protein